ncbi:MAG TPA: hypothetical protein O0X50_00640 [Methanocorpusculum sp.]|nr:hypothetical protein [Methanocorpusculum sp.]
MNGRKFVIVSMLALVLTCCIAAAGCTGSMSVSTEKEIMPAEITGIWGGIDPSGTHGYFVFYENGTGVRYIEAGSDYQTDAYVWNITDSGCDMVYGDGGITMRVPLELNADHTSLIDTSGLILTRQTEIPVLQ